VSVEALLIGPMAHGGEEIYTRTVTANPPPGVRYRVAGSFHQQAPGARCELAAEILLNRVVRPLTIPDMGFRAMSLRDRFDLVHVHAHPVHLRDLGSTPLVFSEGSSSAVYLHEYLGWKPRQMRRAYRRARRVYRALRIHDRLVAQERAARVYVFSRWAKSVNVEWGADPDKTEVVYPGFPTPPERPRREREEFRYLFVGTDFERKGGFEVVEAFAEVLRHVPRTRLTIVAPDPATPNPDRRIHGWVAPERRSRVLAMLAALASRGRVEWRPLVPRERLYAEYYPSADAYVMPTHADGFGFTNIEAMGFGLPVITSVVGPMRELVSDGTTGLLVAPGDVRAVTDAMLRLAQGPQFASELGARGRSAFLERFTVERFRASLGDLYQRALAA
jgi:glycosyltransferase involved in cell wall biosynthesis